VGNYDWKAVARVLLLTLVAVAFWFLAKYGYARPGVLGRDAPAAAFSAGRAGDVLARILGPQRPHPVSSAENAAVRARILAEFARLGIEARTHTAFACNPWWGFGIVSCATVTDIVADVVPGEGRAVVLLAHYDSVPAGPGASDDGSGTAIVLETARALMAQGGKGRHPVLAVITDGEEAGLLGAQAFLEDKALRSRAGAIVNVEARGTRGRSLLFQTSPGDSKLIDLYRNSVPFYATSSLYAEIYRLMPNDTDLTLFIRRGFPSFNFAFSENVADYHTPLDRRENLSPLTLQQQGENMLGVARALRRVSFGGLKGRDDIYLDLFGAVLPRTAASWALPLSIMSLLVLLGAAVRARVPGGNRRDWIAALMIPPVFLIASGLAGWALHLLAQAISGQPDPSYAYPIALREGLAFGVLAMALLAARMAEARRAALAVWLWFAASSVAAAALVPGFSPYFLFPALFAALAGLVTMIWPAAMRGRLGDCAFLPAALLALSIWMGLAAAGEGLMGLKLHALFTIPAAFAAMTLLPFADVRAMARGTWRDIYVAAIAGALIATVIAGLQPAYSRTQAQRLSIRYVEKAGAKDAAWALDSGAPLPAPLRAAANFASQPERILPRPFPEFYTAPAGAPRFALPRARIVSDTADGAGRHVTVALQGSAEASSMALLVPPSAKLRSIDIRGARLAVPREAAGDLMLACESRDCAGATYSLTFASRDAVALDVLEQRYGLPAFANRLAGARPRTAVPSQSGDLVLLAGRVEIQAK
jgi:hypothetical protein